MVKVYHNGNEIINFNYGMSATNTLNEELDTGFISFNHMEQTEIKQFDRIEIIDQATKISKKMLINVCKENISSFSYPRKYNYDISLISSTILLQRITLPNKSITQSLNVEDAKSVWTVIQMIHLMYCPHFKLDTELKIIYDDIVCPEFQWNRPTVYEVFNDLFSTKNRIVTINEWDILAALDLNKLGNPISEKIIGNEQLVKNANEYAYNLEMEAVNCITNNVSKTTGYIGLRSKEVMITSDNLCLILPSNVYKIVSIQCKFKAYHNVMAGLPANDPLQLDITKHIVEKTEYDLLRTSNQVSIIRDLGYKRNNIYYTRGSNIIEGFSFHEDTWVAGINTKIAIFNILMDAFYSAFFAYPSASVNFNTGSSKAQELIFQVEYIPLEDTKFRTSKSHEISSANTLIHNQDNSYVDIDTLGKSTQKTINRIGNPEMIITGQVEKINLLPALGDYIENYKLVKLTYFQYESWTNYQAVLYKNYTNMLLFTGVNSVKRYTQIVSGSDALIRNELTPFNFKLTFNGNASPSSLEKYLIQIGKYDRRDSHVLRTFFANGGYSSLLLIPSTTKKVANSIISSFKMEDNKSAGKQIDVGGIFGNTFSQRDVSYVDTNGEFKMYYLYFGGGNYVIKQVMGEEMDLDNYQSLLDFSLKLPELLYDGPLSYLFEHATLRNKDNREIMAETFQFNFTGEGGIYVYDGFINNNSLLIYHAEDNYEPRKFYLYESSNQLYNEITLIPLGIKNENAFISITENHINIEKITNNVISVGIVDKNNNLVLGINLPNNTTEIKIYIKKV